MIPGLSVARTALREVAAAVAVTAATAVARWLWPHPSDYEWED